MTLAELLPKIRSLSRSERIEVARFLAEELAKDKCLAEIDSAYVHTIWSQYDATEAAVILQRFLAEQST